MTQPPYGSDPGMPPGGYQPPGPTGPPPNYPPGYAAPGYAPGYGPPYAPPYGAPYGYGPPPFVPPAPKPGCVPLRPLGLGDIIDGSFSMLRRNPKVTLGLSAVVSLLQLVLTAASLLVTYALLRNVTVTSSSNPTATTSTGSLLGADGFQLINSVVSLISSAILTGMLTVAVTQDVIGNRVSIGDVWRQVKGRIWRLIGLAFLTAFIEGVGVVLCLAPGIWLWGIWAVSVPAFIVERTTIRGAWGRSRALVQGTFWRVWGIRALGTLIASFIGGIIAAPFLIFGLIADSSALSDTSGNLPVLFVILAATGSAVSATITAPIRAGIDALLYVDLRMRKEGLDIVLQQAASKAGTIATPGPAIQRSAF